MAAADLRRYPRPNVAVDIAILTALPGRTAEGSGVLAVLLYGPSAPSLGRALPGRFLREGQTVAESVIDVLEVKAGLRKVRAEARLLRVFDDPGRDPRGWTVSLAHALTLAPRLLHQATGSLVGITTTGELESGESLLFDHDSIVREAAAAIRNRYEQLPDPDGLLEHPFTMAELKGVHESVIGKRLLKDTFRRRMEPHLRPVMESDGLPVLRSDGGRPARVFVRDDGVQPSASTPRRFLLPRAER